MSQVSTLPQSALNTDTITNSQVMASTVLAEAYSLVDDDTLFATFGENLAPITTSAPSQHHSSGDFDFGQTADLDSNREGQSADHGMHVATGIQMHRCASIPVLETDASPAWETYFYRPSAGLIRDMAAALPSDGIHSFDSDHTVPNIGPVHIQRVKESQTLPSAAPYTFQFRFGNKCELMHFRYSGYGDIWNEVQDFVEQNDIDDDMVMPIQAVIDAYARRSHSSVWEIAVSRPKTEYNAVGHERSTSHPSLHQFLPEDSTRWTARNTSRGFEYDHGKNMWRCRLEKEFAAPTELQRCLGQLTQDWREFSVADFLEMSEKQLARASEDLWVRQLTGKIASATLITIAQMLHASGKGCDCDSDDAFEDEAYQLELRQKIMSVLPLNSERRPQLHRLRTRYAFALLELAMETYVQTPEQLLSYLKQDMRSIKAAQCLANSVDLFADSYDDFIGAWGWNGIVSKLIPTASSSAETDATGSIRGQVSVGGTKSGPDATAATRPKARTQGMSSGLQCKRCHADERSSIYP